MLASPKFTQLTHSVCQIRKKHGLASVSISLWIRIFGYSRLDDPRAVSIPLRAQDEAAAYQHPELTENPRIGYRREYDAYSLGIVLTEIGLDSGARFSSSKVGVSSEAEPSSAVGIPAH